MSHKEKCTPTEVKHTPICYCLNCLNERASSRKEIERKLDELKTRIRVIEKDRDKYKARAKTAMNLALKIFKSYNEE